MVTVKQPLSTKQLVFRIALNMLLQGLSAFITLVALQYKVWIAGTFFSSLTFGYSYALRLVLNDWRTPK